jgi:hypothetical protein
VKRLLILVLLAALPFAALAFAADDDATPKPEITPTPEPAAQLDCDTLIKQAVERMDKGKAKLGRASMFLDKQMEAEGKALYDQGKALLQTAAGLGPVCAAKVEKLEAGKKRKAGKSSAEQTEKSGSGY